MESFWIDLPVRWQLQNIQAGLNVIICAISALATYCVVRFCWQIGTHKIRDTGHTPLSSLFTTNTLGEVLDAVKVLRLRIFSRQHILLLTQCVLVCLFAMTTLLSGPVARWSTRTGHKLAVIDTPVYPAMKEFDIIAYANNYWTDIEHSMNDAEFPYDRLLDFLPDTKAQWKYVADQWTRTWSMHCESVPRTPIDLDSTGECKGYTVPEGASVRYETLPQLYSVLNISNFELSGDDWAGFSVSNKPQAKDMLLFIYGHNIVDQDSSRNRVYGMNVSIASVHLHNLNKNLTTPNNCSTAAGPIGSATYTRIDCTLSRERKIADEHLVPYPEAVDTEMLIARALSQNFQARFMMESATNRTITEIKPEELIRFYQVYMISKDTQYRQSTLRPLTVSQQVPQLSTAFLAVALLVTVLCMISSSAWCIFKLTHHGVNDVPQTKLDWLLHAIDPNESPADAPRSSIRCRTVGRHDQGELRPPFCRQMSDQEKFESAAYVKDLPRVRRWTRDSASSPWANASYTSCENKHAPSIKESMLSGSSDTPSLDVVLASPAEELSESMFSKLGAR